MSVACEQEAVPSAHSVLALFHREVVLQAVQMVAVQPPFPSVVVEKVPAGGLLVR